LGRPRSGPAFFFALKHELQVLKFEICKVKLG